MHLDFANLLNLVSTVTLIGALIFTGLQVRAANQARRGDRDSNCRPEREFGAHLTVAWRDPGKRFRHSDRQFERGSQAPDSGVWATPGSNGLHGFSSDGGSANRQRSRRWRNPWFLVAREKLVGGEAEANG